MIASCPNCRQRAELHQDRDGRVVCEDCLTDRQALTARTVVVKQEFAPSRKDTLLDYIVAHATPDFITALVEQEVSAYRTLLTDRFTWIEVLEKEPNDRKLLRIATSLGYTLPAPKPPTPDPTPQPTPRRHAKRTPPATS